METRSSTVTQQERASIIGRISTAPFNSKDPRTVGELTEDDEPLRVALLGYPHPTSGKALTESAVLNSWEFHLLKRIMNNEWDAATTLDEFVGDLQAAAKTAGALLHVGRDRKGAPRCKAATRTHVQTLPSKKFKAGGPDVCVFVVYEPERKVIVTGFAPKQKTAETTLRRWSPGFSI